MVGITTQGHFTFDGGVLPGTGIPIHARQITTRMQPTRMCGGKTHPESKVNRAAHPGRLIAVVRLLV